VPTKEQHVAKAEGNASFALSLTLDSTAKIDWALIALFYAALHYIEAYLAATSGIHVRSHETRDRMVARESNLRKIFNEYSDLKYYGYNARYEISPFSAEDVQKHASNHFATIKKLLVPLL
jgi:arginine utilization protein RocB